MHEVRQTDSQIEKLQTDEGKDFFVWPVFCWVTVVGYIAAWLRYSWKCWQEQQVLMSVGQQGDEMDSRVHSVVILSRPPDHHYTQFYYTTLFQNPTSVHLSEKKCFCNVGFIILNLWECDKNIFFCLLVRSVVWIPKRLGTRKTSFDLIVAGKVTAVINRHEEEQPDRWEAV